MVVRGDQLDSDVAALCVADGIADALMHDAQRECGILGREPAGDAVVDGDLLADALGVCTDRVQSVSQSGRR